MARPLVMLLAAPPSGKPAGAGSSAADGDFLRDELELERARSEALGLRMAETFRSTTEGMDSDQAAAAEAAWLGTLSQADLERAAASLGNTGA